LLQPHQWDPSVQWLPQLLRFPLFQSLQLLLSLQRLQPGLLHLVFLQHQPDQWLQSLQQDQLVQ
jgi:hypothetical protein